MLTFPALKVSTQVASDCDTEEVFGSSMVRCGKGERPEVTLTVAPYTGEIGQPKKPENVINTLKSEAPGSTVTELVNKAGKDGIWHVELHIQACFNKSQLTASY